MTKYIATFEFGSNLTGEDAQGWVAAIQQELPEGAIANLRTVPLVLDLEDLTEAHAGNKITVRGIFSHIKNGDTKAAKAQANSLVQNAHLTGILEHVFETGHTSGHGRTLIIDGKAYSIPAYSLVELGEW